MYAGKLYKFNEEQFVTTVNYRLLGDTSVKVSGELIPDEYGQISDGDWSTSEGGDTAAQSTKYTSWEEKEWAPTTVWAGGNGSSEGGLGSYEGMNRF